MTKIAHNRNHHCLLLVLCPIAMLPAAPGCNGVGATLTSSDSALMPGQFVELFSSKIQSGTTLKVRFQGPGGFDVEAETILTDNGSARVAVPPLIDMQTGEFLEGEVQVSLPELSGGSVALTVQTLPQINSPFPGALLREVLLMSLELADAAEAKAAAIAADLPSAVESPSDLEFFTPQRAAIAAILEELDATGQLTVEAANGTIVTLTAQDLALGDRLLASYLVGIIDETGGDSSVALKTATRLQGEGEPILDYDALAAEFRRVSNNIVNGGGAFLGSMTLFVAGGGLMLSGLGPVAVVGGLVLSTGSAVWAIGSSSILNRMGSFFDEKLGELFNLGETAFEQTISLGTEVVGLVEGKLGQLFSGLSTLLTAQGTYENFTKIECQTNPAPNPAPQQKRRSANLQGGSFCAIVLPDVALDLTFTFRNQDSENIHILLPNESFLPENRIVPGASRSTSLADREAGSAIELRAGRNGVVLRTATCPAVSASTIAYEAIWTGSALTCTSQ